MDRMPKVKINTCSRWELLRLPGVGNKIADKICKMREEINKQIKTTACSFLLPTIYIRKCVFP
jgi:predicted DNA-binding helix-hairpin-helix protein